MSDNQFPEVGIETGGRTAKMRFVPTEKGTLAYDISCQDKAGQPDKWVAAADIPGLVKQRLRATLHEISFPKPETRRIVIELANPHHTPTDVEKLVFLMELVGFSASDDNGAAPAIDPHVGRTT